MAAKARTLFLSLAAFCLPALANIPRASLITEKPHLGVENFAMASRLGLAAANALIAPGLCGCLYDSGRRSRNTGKERDAETGLDYFGARYLSSAQGRWTSPDWSPNPEPVPYADLTDPQTLNLYGYVRNNPLASRDPDGHQCIPCLVQEGQAVLAEATPYINRAVAFLAAKGDTIVKAAIVLGGAALAGLESTANSCGGGVGCMATPPEILKMQRKEQGRDAQGKFTGKNEGESAPGKDEEARGLDALGATKNTKPLAGSNRIPDGTITATGQAVEIKSGGTVSNTKQIREMSAAAAKATGQPLVIGTTNPNVRVAGTVSQNPNVVVKPIPPPKQPNQ